MQHFRKAQRNFYKIMDAMDSWSVLTDEAKRRHFATECLKGARLKIIGNKSLYTQNLRLWIENKKKMFDDNIQSNYHLALSHLSIRKNTYELVKKYIKRFAEIECKLLAMKDLAKFNGQHPVINESEELGHGSHFVVYPAEWSTEKKFSF